MIHFAKSKAAHIRLGAAGEAAAARMFRNLGGDVLLQDYRVPKGEIDLIVRDGLCLVFAEVKTLRTKTLEQADMAQPAIHLKEHQRRRIYRAALTYMREIGKPDLPFRFDLVEVIYWNSFLYRIRHHRAAFGKPAYSGQTGEINLFRTNHQ